nr:thioredoxin family protein [uncultured Pseudomonas sp.]
MTMHNSYMQNEPSRAQVEALAAPTLIEFGAPWCGHCRAAQPLIAEALAVHPAVDHLKIEDGKGRALGRSFRVTLWPTLICLRQGKEVARLVRPTDARAIERTLQQIDAVS